MSNFKLLSNNILDKNNKVQNFLIGSIVPFFGSTVPSGWLLCDGTQYSTTGTYKDLYDVIGTTYGSGTGTFAVPSMNNKYASSSNNDNTTNYPTTHTHSGNVSYGTSSTHSQSHTHTAPSVGINVASASHNHNTSGTNVNGGLTPGSNANSVANRAVNPGPAANSPQAGWVGHTHNAGSGTINVGNDAYNHNHNVMNIAGSYVSAVTAPGHNANSNSSFSYGNSTYSPLGVKMYFIIKY